MSSLNTLQKILKKIVKMILEEDKTPKTLLQIYIATLQEDGISTSLRTALLLIFAAGILAQVFFVSLVVGVGVLYILLGVP